MCIFSHFLNSTDTYLISFDKSDCLMSCTLSVNILKARPVNSEEEFDLMLLT